jgi:hypothetical protein
MGWKYFEQMLDHCYEGERPEMWAVDTLDHWFSNWAPQEVARCAANIMKVYCKNEKKLICVEMFIHSLKYINLFLISYTKCTRKFLYFTVRRKPKKFENHCFRYWLLFWM